MSVYDDENVVEDRKSSKRDSKKSIYNPDYLQVSFFNCRNNFIYLSKPRRRDVSYINTADRLRAVHYAALRSHVQYLKPTYPVYIIKN